MADTQDSLFPDLPRPEDASAAASPSAKAQAAEPSAKKKPRTATVEPAPTNPELVELAAALPPNLRLGTSSWSYPGWADLVWDGEYAETVLSKNGLSALAKHPLFRTVSVDRNFYRALTASQYARYASMVPDDFRFMVKAPSLVTDATVRDESGRGMQANPVFLSSEIARQEFVLPALEGLGHRIGVLVFQLSPIPGHILADQPALLARIAAMLESLPDIRSTAPDAVIAVEVRDPQLLNPAFAEMLRSVGATFCMGLHAKMPPIEDQLPMLRALWPGPLVCRWNLHRRHGRFGYEDAEKLYGPFDKIVDPDPETRAALAKVIAGTTRAGQNAFVTVSNNAEGCAPLTIAQLARDILELAPR
ncbi:DUF72 domain-containing protein [Variovorax sp. NFACC27]|uniref:DUF72 domain-containing protein n=1 Tax=unclassified Variovorax TaxID=663243 RepID=UPI000894CA83|nr:Uncharacterized conserved protein YecE, DUF72 family [Variovorax sp. NFACC28]SEG69577.1 Uncharacterized conserved protein YecE, DUF72 family [Variovorax sp. NFACC29]SFC84197.1 Uncharacterized conserved protein YecE, DUF72 family [Variovorax sp. NFACC26]SFF97622.1 Uncharacterized conserved protein YecE, DUF72 family [Variovorax sp. NFACC27]